MRPVVCVAPLNESSGTSIANDCSSPMASSPMDGLVFPFEEQEAGKTPVPFEQSAAAAAEAQQQLDRLLEPNSEAEAMVRAAGHAWC